MPGAAAETVFAFHKADDKTYVTTSQSTKILVPEGTEGNAMAMIRPNSAKAAISSINT